MLVDAERAVILACMAAVPLYQVAVVGYCADPVDLLLRNDRQDFMNITDWVLTSALGQRGR